MNRQVGILSVGVLCLCLWDTSIAQAASCEGQGPRAVYVRPKTAVRRGPGLNFSVEDFISSGRCVDAKRVSKDAYWVQVNSDGLLGWVLVEALEAKGKAIVANLALEAPTPSNVEKFVKTTRRAALRRKPTKKTILRQLPARTEVKLLKLSKNGLWVNVRLKDRGVGWISKRALRPDDIAALVAPVEAEPLDVSTPESDTVPPPPPAADSAAADEMSESDSKAGGSETEDERIPPPADFDSNAAKQKQEAQPVAASSSAPISSGTALVESILWKTRNIRTSLSVSGVGEFFQQTRSSNGVLNLVSYNAEALSGGGHIGLQISGLGPITARGAYTIAFFSGVDLGERGQGATTHHLIEARLGLPLRFGSFIVGPELGYQLGLNNWDNLDPNAAFLTATEHHQGIAAARLQWILSSSLVLDLNAGVGFGSVTPNPGPIGSGGEAVSFVGSAGVNWALSQTWAAGLSYKLDTWATSFTGQTQVDPGVTAVNLSETKHFLYLTLFFGF